jgi:tRNA threonylcarbamoyladenosine biosynthesis protein TsaE
MEAVGVRLAAGLPARADTVSVLYLSGDLGVGKTTLARGFIRGCGIRDAVRSPTYALLEPYEGQDITVVHLDLYRLCDPAELEALGLRDWASPKHVWLIEWPEKGGSSLPPPDLHLTLSIVDHAHQVIANATSAFGQAWLAAANTA